MPSPITDADRDSALQSFISLVRQRSDLKDQVKSARDQDDVIALAQAEGFPIDSLTLLRVGARSLISQNPRGLVGSTTDCGWLISA